MENVSTSDQPSTSTAASSSPTANADRLKSFLMDVVSRWPNILNEKDVLKGTQFFAYPPSQFPAHVPPQQSTSNALSNTSQPKDSKAPKQTADKVKNNNKGIPIPIQYPFNPYATLPPNYGRGSGPDGPPKPFFIPVPQNQWPPTNPSLIPPHGSYPTPPGYYPVYQPFPTRPPHPPNLTSNQSKSRTASGTVPPPSARKRSSESASVPTSASPAVDAVREATKPSANLPTPTSLQPPRPLPPAAKSVPSVFDLVEEEKKFDPAAYSSGKLRTTEAERVAQLTNDPYVVSFTKDSVRCKNCDKTLKLYGKNYYLKVWTIHREACLNPREDRKPPLQTRITAAPLKPTIKTRQDTLKEDPQVECFDETHILCKFCKQRIGTGINRNLGAWGSHKRSCRGPPDSTVDVKPVIPSTNGATIPVRNRTTEAQRIQELRNDPNVLSFGQDFVVCKLCHQRIKLTGSHYLSTWHRHRFPCDQKHKYNNASEGFVKREIIEDPDILSAGPVVYNLTNSSPSKVDTRPYIHLLSPSPPPQFRPPSKATQYRSLQAIAASLPKLSYDRMPSYATRSCDRSSSVTAETDGEGAEENNGMGMSNLAPAHPSFLQQPSSIPGILRPASAIFTSGAISAGTVRVSSPQTSSDNLHPRARKKIKLDSHVAIPPVKIKTLDEDDDHHMMMLDDVRLVDLEAENPAAPATPAASVPAPISTPRGPKTPSSASSMGTVRIDFGFTGLITPPLSSASSVPAPWKKVKEGEKVST